MILGKDLRSDSDHFPYCIIKAHIQAHHEPTVPSCLTPNCCLRRVVEDAVSRSRRRADPVYVSVLRKHAEVERLKS